MSFMRHGTPSAWEDDAGSPYVYMQTTLGETARLTGFDGARPATVVEVVMRMLEQSGHLDDDELEKCHAALRYRLHLSENPSEDDQVGRDVTVDDASMGASEIVVWADDNGHDDIARRARELYEDIEAVR